MWGYGKEKKRKKKRMNELINLWKKEKEGGKCS